MQSSFSMTTLYDANTLQSHIITTLEQADTLDNDNPIEYKMKKNLLTTLLHDYFKSFFINVLEVRM